MDIGGTKQFYVHTLPAEESFVKGNTSLDLKATESRWSEPSGS